MPYNPPYTFTEAQIMSHRESLEIPYKLTLEQLAEYVEGREITKRYLFKPYDKILVRNCKEEIWTPTFFAGYLLINYHITVMATDTRLYNCCVAYDDYPYLAFDNDEPEEFYRERLMKNGDALAQKLREAVDSIGKDNEV